VNPVHNGEKSQRGWNGELARITVRPTCERPVFAGRESSIALARPESRVSRVAVEREWPDARSEDRVGEWILGLASRSRLLRRSLLLRRFWRSIISSILSKRRTEDEAVSSTGSVFMGVAGGKEGGGGASAADMERDLARRTRGSMVGLLTLSASPSPSDSALENARRELAF
jgi:hypothetical protein